MAEYLGCQDMRDLLTAYLHSSRDTKISEDLRHNIIKMGENIVTMMELCNCAHQDTIAQLKAHVEVCTPCQQWLISMMS